MGDILKFFNLILVLMSLSLLVVPAAAGEPVDPDFLHCVDETNVSPETVVSACTQYINEAYLQGWGYEYVPKALRSQALAYGRLGKIGEAKTSLAAAIKKAPDYFAAWETLVEQQMGMSGVQANETAVDAMVKNAPNNGDVLAQACRVRGLDGISKDLTMAACDEAVRKEPDKSFTFFSRCYARYKFGDFANAVADCDTAIKLDKDNVAAHYVEGLAKVQSGLADGGNADIAAAKAAAPDIAEEIAAYPDWY